MKSMTGFGRGSASDEERTITVELSAVNSRKQVDMRFSIPRDLLGVESQLRQRIQGRLSRGSLHVTLSSTSLVANGASVVLNREAALAAANVLKELSRSAGLPQPTLQDVLAVPGVLAVDGAVCDEATAALALQALDCALDALEAARCEEGGRLAEDLLARADYMDALLQRIISRESESLQEFKARLAARLIELGAPITADDDERLARELCYYADKSDITEETVRLKSHLVKFRQLITSGEAPGRELEFLGQEMNREANTLSAKTCDGVISQDAMALKVELSKIREQIMNIE